MSPGIMTGVGGASLDWDRRRRVTPVQTASQEAWPEAEPLGWNNSLRREPRWNAVKRARSKRARAASQDAEDEDQRLPTFRFLQLLFEVLIWRSSTEDRKAGPPLPFPWTGFALNVTTFLQACDPFAIARTTEGCARKTRCDNVRAWHESREATRPSPPARPQSKSATTRKSCRGTPCRNHALCAPCRFCQQARRAHRLPSCVPR
jgi:hypothetical protein